MAGWVSVKLRHGYRQVAHGGQGVAGILLLAAEFGHFGLAQFRGGQRHGGGVDRLAVETGFVMQMRAGGAAGAAHLADDFTGAHFAAGG